jgi:hypothetical protein
MPTLKLGPFKYTEGPDGMISIIHPDSKRPLTVSPEKVTAMPAIGTSLPYLLIKLQPVEMEVSVTYW